MHIVMLSGGSGRRLWPLSNDLYSKQYIKIVNRDSQDKGQCEERCSMLQRVHGQLQNLKLDKNLVVVASEPQIEIIQNQLGKEIEIVVEPDRRDTMPAILLACAWLKSEKKVSKEEYVAVLPVDSYTEQSFFEQLSHLEEEMRKTKAAFGLIGAQPTYPSEKYGYIMPEKKDIGKQIISVHSFKEKPDAKTAETLIAQGGLWNCGVVCFSMGVIVEYMEWYRLPEQYAELAKGYNKIPALSFDYGVLEKSTSLTAIRYDGIWKDLGTWNTLTEEMPEQSIGNVIWDKESDNSHAINVLDIPMVIMGGKNLAVVASHDGILVADKSRSSYLKECLEGLEFKPRFEERAWGIIKTLDSIEHDEQKSIITNRIKVFKEKHTTYHLHKKHEEMITVLSGKGILILENKPIVLSEGVSVRVAANQAHAIKAVETLKYIEILIGECNMDDIERLLFDWSEIAGRAAK